jgi:regulator of sigma E protease
MVGVLEPRAVVARPAAGTPAAHALLREGDLVLNAAGAEVRSWNDLNWIVLREAVERREVPLVVRGSDGVTRDLTLDLRGVSAADGEGNPLTRVGLAPYGGPPRLARIAEGSAAQAAGLKEGDRALEVDRQAVRSARDLSERVAAAAGKPIELLIERDGQQRLVMVTPARVTDDSGRTVGRMGVQLSERPELVKVHYGPVESLGVALTRTWDTAVFSLRMLGKMLIGEASWKNLSGPVTIADYAGQTAKIGLASYLSFLALVSISLGVLNLLPIPMLDGGHLLYYAIEILKGSPPAEWAVEWGQRAGIAALFLLTALALYNDIARLLS